MGTVVHLAFLAPDQSGTKGQAILASAASCLFQPPQPLSLIRQQAIESLFEYFHHRPPPVTTDNTKSPLKTTSPDVSHTGSLHARVYAH